MSNTTGIWGTEDNYQPEPDPAEDTRTWPERCADAMAWALEHKADGKAWKNGKG